MYESYFKKIIFRFLAHTTPKRNRCGRPIKNGFQSLEYHFMILNIIHQLAREVTKPTEKIGQMHNGKKIQ